ncbi:hypothetical protein CALK_0194 [Chitinivibrio alkaliphilus ACht1]|uniref:Iron export ABC transporter permease subunit FetB n=2 Tax=Chitinivibrio TaxID=1505231 RepID=U7DCU8_9BACT|nr:hypothetical protein CALK_0194 [Chitinivibrio alkaliphilus ACht1]
MENMISISLPRLAAAYVFVLLLILLVQIQRIGATGQILLANIRMTIQLVCVGYLLTILFENPSPIFSTMVLLCMLAFAVHTVLGRIQHQLPLGIGKTIPIALVMGSFTSLFFFIVVVLNLDPWYDPHYIIPLAGMIIGNSMTGISLTITGLFTGVRDNRSHIETALMLGAKPERVMESITAQAFFNAILPTINSMMGMGIVFLPGMMTGQILAGAPPMLAIKYQIAIMLAILGSVTLTVFVMVRLGGKSFFNERAQLVIPEQGSGRKNQ